MTQPIPNEDLYRNPVAITQLDEEMNVKYRVIYLQDAIDSFTPSHIHSRALAIAELSGNEKESITLQISCYGGDVYSMLGAVDVMRILPMKINTMGMGPVFSAAATILAGGTGVRSLSKNTILMNHEMSSWFQGKTSDIESEAKHNKQLQEKLYTLLGSCTKKDADFWRKNSKTNLYLPAETCKRYGIIDKIL